MRNASNRYFTVNLVSFAAILLVRMQLRFTAYSCMASSSSSSCYTTCLPSSQTEIAVNQNSPTNPSLTTCTIRAYPASEIVSYSPLLPRLHSHPHTHSSTATSVTSNSVPELQRPWWCTLISGCDTSISSLNMANWCRTADYLCWLRC